MAERPLLSFVMSRMMDVQPSDDCMSVHRNSTIAVSPGRCVGTQTYVSVIQTSILLGEHALLGREDDEEYLVSFRRSRTMRWLEPEKRMQASFGRQHRRGGMNQRKNRFTHIHRHVSTLCRCAFSVWQLDEKDASGFLCFCEGCVAKR